MSVLGVSSYQRTPKMRQKVLRQSMSLRIFEFGAEGKWDSKRSVWSGELHTNIAVVVDGDADAARAGAGGRRAAARRLAQVRVAAQQRAAHAAADHRARQHLQPRRALLLCREHIHLIVLYTIYTFFIGHNYHT